MDYTETLVTGQDEVTTHTNGTKNELMSC